MERQVAGHGAGAVLGQHLNIVLAVQQIVQLILVKGLHVFSGLGLSKGFSGGPYGTVRFWQSLFGQRTEHEKA